MKSFFVATTLLAAAMGTQAGASDMTEGFTGLPAPIPASALDELRGKGPLGGRIGGVGNNNDVEASDNDVDAGGNAVDASDADVNDNLSDTDINDNLSDTDINDTVNIQDTLNDTDINDNVSDTDIEDTLDDAL
jgi:hypothetical protein